MAKSTGRKQCGGCLGLGGGGSEELVFSGDRVSLWEDENVEVGGGDGCIEV